MKGYGTRTVAGMLGLSEDQVRSYVRAGFLQPGRGPRGAFQFSFQDLVFLRTAKGLIEARIGPRRVRRALRKLREQLPPGRRLSGLRIRAEGGRVVVADGASTWQPESGQILFDFEFDVAELARKVAPVLRHAFKQAKKAEDALSADEWYAWGCELEPTSLQEALEAYGQAIALDPAHAGAHVNLGRLLHDGGDVGAAEQHYRAALAVRPDDPVAAFNLGVALEDFGRIEAAIQAYERAIALDPANSDAHYNAARLYERRGEMAAAMRHLKVCRKLQKDDS